MWILPNWSLYHSSCAYICPFGFCCICWFIGPPPDALFITGVYNALLCTGCWYCGWGCCGCAPYEVTVVDWLFITALVSNPVYPFTDCSKPDLVCSGCTCTGCGPFVVLFVKYPVLGL